MSGSFLVRRDKHFDSVQYRLDHETYHQYKKERYFINWQLQESLVLGDAFPIQIVANGNTITLSWTTVIVSASGGNVVSLKFDKLIDPNLISNLSGSPGQGQNFPIFVNDSSNYIMWIDVDGSVIIDPTGGNLQPIAQDGNSGTVWGSSITWTTDN